MNFHEVMNLFLCVCAAALGTAEAVGGTKAREGKTRGSQEER